MGAEEADLNQKDVRALECSKGVVSGRETRSLLGWCDLTKRAGRAEDKVKRQGELTQIDPIRHLQASKRKPHTKQCWLAKSGNREWAWRVLLEREPECGRGSKGHSLKGHYEEIFRIFQNGRFVPKERIQTPLDQ